MLVYIGFTFRLPRMSNPDRRISSFFARSSSMDQSGETTARVMIVCLNLLATFDTMINDQLMRVSAVNTDVLD